MDDYDDYYFTEDMDEEGMYDYPFDEGEMTPEMLELLKAYRQGNNLLLNKFVHVIITVLLAHTNIKIYCIFLFTR